MRQGETKVARLNSSELDRHVQKGEGIGAGFWGAGRGWLTHHVVIEQGKLTNYQICTPSTINASPRDPWDQPGAYEQAVLGTPILEKMSDPTQFTSVDMLRAIRSFDPCMPCTTHVSTGRATVVREVNTCSCSADG